MTIAKTTEIHVLPFGTPTSKQVNFHNSWAINGQGQFALELMKSAVASGRPMDAAAIVKLCCDISALSADELDRRGWVVEMPKWEELMNDAPITAGFLNNV
jgi:hypothetical protein